MKTKIRYEAVSAGVCLTLLVAPLSSAKQAHAPSAKQAIAQKTEAAPPSGSEIDQKSEQILKKLSAFYKGLKAFSVSMTSDMRIELPTKQNQFTSEFSIVFQRPNKFSMNLQSGKLGGTMINDGTTLTMYSPVFKKYVSAASPASLSTVFGTLDYQLISGGFSSITLLDAMCDEDPYKQIMVDVNKVTYVGTEKLNDRECDHLKFTQKDLSWDLFVDTGKEPWIRQVKADMSKMVSSRAPAGIPADDMKNLKMELTVSYADTKSNITPAPDQFTFKPPEGATAVKSFFERPKQRPTGGTHLQAGEPAPEFTLDTVNGTKFDLAEKKGRIVVLDFWATWCPPCRAGLPILAQVTESFKDKGVIFCPVNLAESKETIAAFLEKQNLKLDVALDSEGRVGELYKVREIPQTVIIGKDGKIAQIHVGIDNLKESFTAELSAVIDGKTKEAKVESSSTPTK